MITKRFFGIRMRQRDDGGCFSCFVFVCSARELSKWSGIRRVGQAENGTQRVRKPSRVKAIRRFLEASPINVIPSSVLLSFSPNTTKFDPIGKGVLDEAGVFCSDPKISYGFLSFSYEEDVEETDRPALVVDGQHRLGGMDSLDGENILLNAVAMLDVDIQEQAFQFIVLNNKAVRVPTDNVKAILAGLDEQALSERLLRAGVSYGDISPVLREINDLPQSPFRDSLDWPYNRSGERLVALTSIEQCLRYIRNEFGGVFEDDEDSVVEFFCALWRPIREKWDSLWNVTGDSKLLSKVSICALNEAVVHRMKIAREFGMLDVYDPTSVQRLCESILASFSSLFWTSEWRVKVQDNANVRKNDCQ